MTRLVTSLFMIAILTLPNSVRGGTNSGAVIGLHALEALGSDPCFSATPLPRCYNLNTQVSTLSKGAYVYVLIINPGSIAGGTGSTTIGSASFGISYDAATHQGVDILNWTLCADNAVSWNWPAANSGLTVSWNSSNCQTRVTGSGDPSWDGVAAVVGYFYVSAYTSSQLKVIPHPETGKALVSDCAGIMDEIGNYRLGWVGFGNIWGGYNPCEVLDVYPCDISGPTSLESGSSGQFSASNGNSYMPPGSWSIHGNGAIVGPNSNPALTVHADSPGQLTVSYTALYYPGPGAFTCSKIVTVTEGTPVIPMTWGGIKAMRASH